VSSLSVVREPGGGLRFWAGCGKGLCSWLERETGAAGDWTSLQGSETGAPVQLREGVVTEWDTDKGLAVDLWGAFSWIAPAHSGPQARLTWPSCCLGLHALSIAPFLAPPWKASTVTPP